MDMLAEGEELKKTDVFFPTEREKKKTVEKMSDQEPRPEDRRAKSSTAAGRTKEMACPK